MGDDELMTAVARGDDAALRELVYRHWVRLFRWDDHVMVVGGR